MFSVETSMLGSPTYVAAVDKVNRLQSRKCAYCQNTMDIQVTVALLENCRCCLFVKNN